MSINKEVSSYWLDHYIDKKTGLCCLCANKGIILLSERESAAGNKLPGSIVYCLCPNGQELRQWKGNGLAKKRKKQT